MGRLKTGKGQFVGWKNLPHSLTSFSQALRRKFFGRFPRQPWIPFAASKKLDEILRSNWKVWEVGSGFSTLWLSDRVQSLVSIEASEEWFKLLCIMIEGEKIDNVDLRYEWRGSVMSDFSELPDGHLDLLFIDGGPRSECFTKGFPKVKKGDLFIAITGTMMIFGARAGTIFWLI
ncbi:hypothetical protein [Cyanobium sp. ATX-6F1]|uniref:hypothetical protein n=1 Tax=Cyanobium sp. ATX-6F1 TaxID=3137388 RepID=UPI0039BDB59F